MAVSKRSDTSSLCLVTPRCRVTEISEISKENCKKASASTRHQSTWITSKMLVWKTNFRLLQWYAMNFLMSPLWPTHWPSALLPQGREKIDYRKSTSSILPANNFQLVFFIFCWLSSLAKYSYLEMHDKIFRFEILKNFMKNLKYFKTHFWTIS